MRSSQQQVPKGREPPRHGDLWTEQKRVRGCAGSAAERPVMPVKISNAPEPIPESVLSCKLPSVQIGRGVCVEMQVGVASKHFHLVFVLRSSTECGEATQSLNQGRSHRRTKGPKGAVLRLLMGCRRRRSEADRDSVREQGSVLTN